VLATTATGARAVVWPIVFALAGSGLIWAGVVGARRSSDPVVVEFFRRFAPTTVLAPEPELIQAIKLWFQSLICIGVFLDGILIFGIAGHLLDN
jgi:hypothetical protein